MTRGRIEGGYTLIEVTIVSSIMFIILALFLGALDSLTKSTVRVGTVVTNEATVRFGLDSMQRDIRAANPVDTYLSTSSYNNSVQVELGPNPGTRTYIRWFYDTTPTSPTYETILRQVMSGPGSNATVTSQSPVIAHVRNVESGTPLLSFYDSKGNDLVATNPNTPANVANCVIRVHAQVIAGASSVPQPFTENIDIELRNRVPGGIGC